MFKLCPFFVLSVLKPQHWPKKNKSYEESLQKDTYEDLIHLERNIK